MIMVEFGRQFYVRVVDCYTARFEGLKAMLLKIQVFCDVMLCRLVDGVVLSEES